MLEVGGSFDRAVKLDRMELDRIGGEQMIGQTSVTTEGLVSSRDHRC